MNVSYIYGVAYITYDWVSILFINKIEILMSVLYCDLSWLCACVSLNCNTRSSLKGLIAGDSSLDMAVYFVLKIVVSIWLYVLFQRL